MRCAAGTNSNNSRVKEDEARGGLISQDLSIPRARGFFEENVFETLETRSRELQAFEVDERGIVEERGIR